MTTIRGSGRGFRPTTAQCRAYRRATHHRPAAEHRCVPAQPQGGQTREQIETSASCDVCRLEKRRLEKVSAVPRKKTERQRTDPKHAFHSIEAASKAVGVAAFVLELWETHSDLCWFLVRVNGVRAVELHQLVPNCVTRFEIRRFCACLGVL